MKSVGLELHWYEVENFQFLEFFKIYFDGHFKQTRSYENLRGHISLHHPYPAELCKKTVDHGIECCFEGIQRGLES